MNEYDTEIVRSILGKEGCCFVEDKRGVDIVLHNTCSVRENAHWKVYGHIHQLLHDHQYNHIKIGVLGCLRR